METENPGIDQPENEDQKVIPLPIQEPPKGYIFSQDSLKKNIRLSEFLSEKIITGVAFLSIAIIVLIFFFVFREAAPIFSGKPEKKTESSTSTGPERYGEETTGTTSDKPERYTGAEEQKPERYGVTEDSAQTQVQHDQDSVLSDRGETAIPGSDRATFKKPDRESLATGFGQPQVWPGSPWLLEPLRSRLSEYCLQRPLPSWQRFSRQLLPQNGCGRSLNRR